ncbi:hypothetical protein [Pseudomonas sp. B392_1p]|uniref:hypothetical protein n=1 Tax=Pseudomonas sp. B392_1p TaxID=3457507 RepID=UPI003FD1ABF6
MHIKISPVRMDETLNASKVGDVITLNGQPFDFTQLPEGATLPAEAIESEHFTGPIERINGELHLTLRLPHGPNPSQAVAFPEPIHVTEDGDIPLPFDPEPEPEVLEELLEEGGLTA